MIIPISTSTSIHRTPWVNYGVIAANVLIYMIFGGTANPHPIGVRVHELGAISGDDPQLFQFITYQFLHANLAHIGFNMLFLWVFGNSVNAKMGHTLYLCFYLAGGIFAAAGYAFFVDVGLVGASGAIAAVTTAYLILFPRSYIKILYWWFIIGTFEIPSMWMIGFKLILFDNIIAPKMVSGGNVAYGAHLAGYLFGFIAPIVVLWLRVVPRDQFDMLALWRRWYQRRSMQAAMADPEARVRAQYGRVARPVSVESVTVRDPQQDKITDLRSQIADAIAQMDRDQAAKLYEEVLLLDPRQVLARPQQLEVANQLYALNKLPQAASAYEKYLSHYPNAPDADHVKLLLGIIYARDLQQYEVAEAHLTQLLERFTDEKRLDQCRHWLKIAAAGLGHDVPDK
jgi:membrane associated rhomboid family serine protease